MSSIEIKASKPGPGLYVVATPIGNLSDISIRALEVLSNCDRIACEDTRVTAKLLQRYAIKTPMLAYHEHNEAAQASKILNMLDDGQIVALVSDAGTPLVSDPGSRLVASAIDEGHKVIPVPGASSPIAALSAAGLSAESFLFVGFLPPKKVARVKRLQTLSDMQATLVFLESPKRIIATLEDCSVTFGNERKAVVARELTKLYETFHRGTLGDLSRDFAADGAPKGEIVLLIEPGEKNNLEQEEIDERLKNLLIDHTVKDASEILSKQTELPKRDLYQRALHLKKSNV